MTLSSIPISQPQILNIQKNDISPLISTCQIKIMYLGENRNGSVIDKSTADKMAKTLRGCPIVGYYKNDKGDFRDHGEVVTVDADGVTFNSLTIPYGFIAPDAEIWYQDFDEYDGDSSVPTRRTYLMSTGFLWTGQYPECEAVIREGRPQSMELDEHSLEGHWTDVENHPFDLFIITDAIFSKLCILGQDVEPCFEGANITASFSYKQIFNKSLFTFMQEFNKFKQGGNNDMVEQNTPAATVDQTPEQSEPIIASETVSTDNDSSAAFVDSASQADSNVDVPVIEEVPSVQPDSTVCDIETENQLKDFAELKQKYEILEKQNAELTAFQQIIVKEKKETLIKKFSMLSAEALKPITDNLDTFTLDTLEDELYKTLGKIEFEKYENIHINQEGEGQVKLATATFTINDIPTTDPDWVQALDKAKAKNVNF